MADLFNAADYLVTRNLEQGRGGHDAVRGTQTLTYAQLDELCGDVAAAYRAAGLRRDDRVVMVMSDDVPMLSAILGAFRAGVVAVPVSTMFNGSELGKLLADSGARVLVCTPEFLEAVGEALVAAPDIGVVVLVGDAVLSAPDGVRLVSWEEFVASGQTAEPSLREAAGTDEDSWALWLYTSGTTGLPKAAMHRHANIRHVCETYGTQVLGIIPDDSTLSVAKMFFAYGIGNSVFFPLSVGAVTILEPRRPTPAVVRERLEADLPTLFFGVPTFFAALLASDIPDDSFASVRLAASAGEALPEPLLRRFKERFGVDIIDGIGSTEALHIFLSNRPGQIHPGTTGTPVPGYDVAIRDDAGQPVPAGQPGALHVRGASIALGYWRRTEASRQVFRGEWLVTGDTYVCDEHGYFTCLGRNTDMLKAGGIWVSPAEVESRLLEHPAVLEAAVVGLADADGLDKPVAVVVMARDHNTDEATLIAWCRDGLAHFKAPRHIVFVDELPKTATGKLQRFKVRALLATAAAIPAEDLSATGATP
jgi:benzoate-CoA ligase family protein